MKGELESLNLMVDMKRSGGSDGDNNDNERRSRSRHYGMSWVETRWEMSSDERQERTGEQSQLFPRWQDLVPTTTTKS